MRVGGSRGRGMGTRCGQPWQEASRAPRRRSASARRRAWWLAFPLTLGLGACGGPRLALAPIPVQDDDRYDVPEPKERVRDDYYDVVDCSVYQPVKQIFDLPRHFRALGGAPKQALNVTPLDDIQDSTWFTHRVGSREITPEELRQGPNAPVGPDTHGPWKIVRAKTQGVTPGFTIEDPGGHRFVIKFDPLTDPELSTGAEAISTRFFWALGYHVPENYIVDFDPAILEIDPKATVRQGKKRRPMTRADLDLILSKVPPAAGGGLHAIASRLIGGKPLGPPPWLGRRKDDPNDVIPHEHRRELRAYRVFCAWLNHNDSRQINAMDFFVEEEGRHFVKHYLIDFSATLGSRGKAAEGVNLRSEGFEYLVDYGAMFKSLASVGLYERPWVGVEYPVIRGVGRFEAEHFDPGSWRPDYPNPAFENLTPQDGFWGAKMVMNFSDAHIRAAVEAAEFTEPLATETMTRVLIERRDRVGRHWFAQVNPLDRFEVADAGGAMQLRFDDLAVRYGFEAARHYRAVIESDGRRGQTLDLESPAVPLSAALASGNATAHLSGDAASGGKNGTKAGDDGAPATRLLQVTIHSALGTGWTPAVRVTLQQQAGGAPRIVRIEHDS